jgi:putative restriction endonuclease
VAGIKFFRLVDSFVETLERLGATVIRSRDKDDSRPARLRVISSDGTTDCILFLWTITEGGGGAGVRPANERRIQMTNVSGIPLQPGQRTLLGGWSEEFGVFAFWDARRHTRFSSKSPSLQVSSETLERAHNLGIATYLRPAALGREVVVAVSPDSLLWYVQHGLPLHNSQDDAASVAELVEATPEIEREFLDTSTNEVEASRRYDLVETMRAYRDAKFKPAVLRAYRHRCAVCGCALKLVDAAHIVPVSHPRSTDSVNNGIALCRLHHGAYDNGLLGFQSNYNIVLNPLAEQRLSQLNLSVGLDEFRTRLPARISVPNVIEVRPSAQNLILGLQARFWPESHVA